jgi:hypothetical protein
MLWPCHPDRSLGALRHDRGALHVPLARRLVVDALNAEWPKFEEKNVTDLGLLIDWCGLYQHPRTEEQDRIFGAALKAINQVSVPDCALPSVCCTW